MMSYILNSHVLGKLKDLSLELSDESPVLNGKADFDLADHSAGATLDTLNGQPHDDLLENEARSVRTTLGP
jgi:hypothetical protein